MYRQTGRLQNDMRGCVEMETRCRIPIWRTFGRIHGMSSHCHLPHCRVLPPGEFNVMIPQSYVSHCRVLPPGEFNGMSFQSHVSHCRVLPLGEFTVMILEPHATLQLGAVTWRNQCHDRDTLQSVIILSTIWKSFSAIFYFFKCSLGFDERRLSYSLRYTCLKLACVRDNVLIRHEKL